MTTQRTFTAPILLPGDPSLALQAATKQYADTKVGSVAATDSTITVAGSATAPTVAVNAIAESQVTGLVTDLSNKQPLDSDLTTIAGLTSGSGNVMAADGSGWISKTYAVLKTALSLVKGDVGLGNVDNTSNATERAAARTLTNARITKRVNSSTSTSTLTPDSDSYDQYNLTAQAAALSIAAPTGTPTDGQMLMLRFKDNATARALTWTITSTGFRVVGVVLPTTTVISKTVYVGSIWNAADSFWDVIAVGQQA